MKEDKMPATRDPELVARKVLRELGIKHGPVKLKPLTQKLGIDLVFEDLNEELSGVLIKEDQKVLIAVNSNHPTTRQHFTIAHEIGHLMLAHSGEIFVDQTLRQRAVVVRRDGRSSEGTDKDEVEANRFAAELLMPRDFVEEEVRKRLAQKPTPSQEALINGLAKFFEVSSQAMEYRLVNLGFSMPA